MQKSIFSVGDKVMLNSHSLVMTVESVFEKELDDNPENKRILVSTVWFEQKADSHSIQRDTFPEKALTRK